MSNDIDNTYKDPRAEYDEVGNVISQVYDGTPNLKRDALGNVTGNTDDPVEGTKFVITSPRTDEEYSFDMSVLVGADWTGMSQNADDIFTAEEIKNYHEFALKGPSSAYKDQTDLGPEIKDFWIKEIWDKVNPGVEMQSHYIESGPVDIDNDWNGNEYTTVVYLTSDMKPEDGGALELWTPNLTDKMKAMACNTSYTFEAAQENNPDILYSFWPKPGRCVVFDSRIPRITRAPEGDKTSIRLVFKGTTVGYTEPTDETDFTIVE